MNKIALIGAGQLGSRHLQGLAKSNVEISIEVVEPFDKSRDVAKQRYEEIESNQKISSINFFESIDELSDALDVVIIATNADVRSKIIKELFLKKQIKNLILEKVLFQTVKEYMEVETLLEETGAKCWVNHPRRMFPFYQSLKNEIKNCEQISYMVQGGAWGLGCNGLHFIDHLAFFSDDTALKIDNDFLHSHIYEAKRSNYVEFNGLLKGRIGNHIFTLYSDKEYAPVSLTVTTDTLTAFIDEANGYARIARKSNDWKWEESQQKIVYFQSELTNILIEQIITTASCDLPTYDEAMKLHIPFIQALLAHMESVDGQVLTLCPIT
ncbi:MAG: Predicted dehydrogenase [uncultured Sulfurovum sp.]|uniref:Predicted dehydrogenase n=1 Tax=uncultured Sulfurovum sp. TaxID=269237 RepID=A0A6S6UG86_9BACT|nr:MAG: Predicted dehydrogenase [uncultured Sulfurovum sp.]